MYSKFGPDIVLDILLSSKLVGHRRWQQRRLAQGLLAAGLVARPQAARANGDLAPATAFGQGHFANVGLPAPPGLV